MSRCSNDSAANNGEGVANDRAVSPPFTEAASDVEVGAETVWTKEYSMDSETESTHVKSKHDNMEPAISSDPLANPLADVEVPEDIELQNVLDLENVLKSMHGSGDGLGRMEDEVKSVPLENELERVMRLENVLRKVNGNLSEFKLVEEALRKLPETVSLDDVDNDSSEMNLGTNQMSDIELALQNEPLLLNDDYRKSFSTIEEWASSQLKQQEPTNPLPKDGSFTLKSEREVMQSAKILFAKKTKTLFRWLHPKDTKADLRQRVDRAWDSLSPHEIEFYYSQVLGPFNHRQVKPMINPRIFELLNIPADLRPDASTCTDAGADADADVDTASQSTSEVPKTDRVSRTRKAPKPKVPNAGIPRRKRGPYKKTLQAQDNSRVKVKRRKRNSSTSSDSDCDYVPNGSTKRRRATKKKKKITKMGKLRLKFYKMKTTQLPESSESDDFDEEEDDSDRANPYKRRFGGVTQPHDNEISAELTRGLEECDKLLDSDSSI